MKAATRCWRNLCYHGHISIHAAREGGDVYIYPEYGLKDISIHAAREGGDDTAIRDMSDNANISIHAAREGGDPHQCGLLLRFSHFNPRRP